MKKLFICFLVFILLGCQYEGSVADDAKDLVAKTTDLNYKTNHNKKYYSYYKPRQVTSIVSEDTYNIFQVNGVDILLSLNVSDIINTAYYSDYVGQEFDFYDEQFIVYEDTKEINGILTGIRIYNYENNYLLQVTNLNVILAANVYENYVISTLRYMLILSSNVEINADNVIADFSNKETIDYEKEQVDLFEVIIPSSGSLEDLIGQHDEVVGSDETDQNIGETDADPAQGE